jgi:hypothetical protein
MINVNCTMLPYSSDSEESDCNLQFLIWQSKIKGAH